MCYHELYIFLGCGHASHSHNPILRAPSCPIKARYSCDVRKSTIITKLGQNSESASKENTPLPPIPRPCSSSPSIASTGSISENQNTGRYRSDSDEGKVSSKCSQNSNTVASSVAELDSGYGSNIASIRNSNKVCCPNRISHPLHTFRVNALCSSCNLQRDHNLERVEARIIDENVQRGRIRRKSNATREETTPVHKDAYRYLYRSDITIDVTPETQSPDLPEQISKLNPRQAYPRGRKERTREVMGPIDPLNGDKRTTIPLLAGTRLARMYIDNNPALTPSSNQQASILQGIDRNLLEKPLPPVPQSPHLSDKSDEPDEGASTEITSNRASVSSQLSAQIDAVARSWHALTFDNVNRDILGRNIKGMDKIMGWQQQQQTQQKQHEKPRAASVPVKSADKPERHVSTGGLKDVAL